MSEKQIECLPKVLKLWRYDLHKKMDTNCNRMQQKLGDVF